MDESIVKIGELVKSTNRPEVLSDIGGTSEATAEGNSVALAIALG